MQLSQFIDYLLLEKKYSLHTINAYQKDIEGFSSFAKDNFQLEQLTEVNYSIIRSWIIQLVDSGITNRSINRKISSLKTFYKYLLKTKQIEVSPLIKHKSLKVSKKIQIPFSDKEVEQVISGFKATTFLELRDKLIIELLYSTGMRRAELINLEVNNIDLEKLQVKVLGKRNKERILPLLSSIKNTAEFYLRERAQIASANTSALFVTSKGEKVYTTLVYRVINNYFSKASTKVKKSPHILRHSFATHLLNEGADLNSVKELLGHSSLASTQVYTHNGIKELSKVYLKSHPRNKK
ncbi:integrase/recombinase XerC [Mesonia phycicola]|uniref:Tyrosine recombinase XerC n=1 Tax=Mesonia phycicola TaxID=579105 RepID=A0A1M6GH61_9FLAO|nr:tyrosine-type recombinase/integrase [Mesonia phycicola]SHJ09213.1 integrase/recombinase XerC [Mesonia phycicola]